MRVLGVLAGTDIGMPSLIAWCNSADEVIAADGAANRLIRAGVVPHVIIGDLDSLDPNLKSAGQTIVEDLDQETTDCDKLLDFVANRHPRTPLFLIGMEGDRFDHVLSSLHSVVRSNHPIHLVLRDGIGFLVRPHRPVSFATQPAQIVSIVPILPCQGLMATGLRWTPDPQIAPGGSTSASNEATDTHATVDLDDGVALVIVQANTTQPDWRLAHGF
ncbi:MAG: thiamine diphosphokinase [Fimbriimonadaceae bacterium]|nr:thiamine diphosphokinase [Fimbriimonadaceae bacterium]